MTNGCIIPIKCPVVKQFFPKKRRNLKKPPGKKNRPKAVLFVSAAQIANAEDKRGIISSRW